ncbi:MAG: hypothetical protein EBZ51_04070 [Synechococcaceae bacterium WB9_2_112]|nr:hypothetical protein [Synechococcaceae bacterium WB9_2_112]
MASTVSLADHRFAAAAACVDLCLTTAVLPLVVRVWLPPTLEGVDPEGQGVGRPAPGSVMV